MCRFQNTSFIWRKPFAFKFWFTVWVTGARAWWQYNSGPAMQPNVQNKAILVCVHTHACTIIIQSTDAGKTTGFLSRLLLWNAVQILFKKVQRQQQAPLIIPQLAAKGSRHMCSKQQLITPPYSDMKRENRNQLRNQWLLMPREFLVNHNLRLENPDLGKSCFINHIYIYIYIFSWDTVHFSITVGAGLAGMNWKLCMNLWTCLFIH